MQSLHQERSLKGLLVLAGLFMAALVVCNLIATKFIAVDLGFYKFVISAGVLPYPITFLITDILSEVYGKRRANQVVLSGFAGSILVMLILSVARQWDAIPTSQASTAAFEEVFGSSWRVILASMTAYLCAQLVDVQVFHFWKRVTRGRHLWLRNNASTFFSQFLDTTLVILVLFTGNPEWPADKMASAILDGWLFKILCAAADTPFAYAGVYAMRRYLGIPGSAAHDFDPLVDQRPG